MLSLERLCYVLLIVICLSGALIIYNVNEENDHVVKIENQTIPEQELIQGSDITKTEELPFYVVGNEKKELYKDIYKNVCSVMEDIKANWKKVEQLGEEELTDTRAVIIFCDDMIEEHVDLLQLGQYIEKGGKVVFAAGIAEGYHDSYLQPIYGYIEKAGKENYQTFDFIKGFFPLQEDQMTYDGYNASTRVSLRKEAVVYVKDSKKGVPIVYSYPYGKGVSLVINATFLSDKRCSGFLMSGLGNLLEDFLYPVLGAECVYLDNFPIVTYVNDPVCMKLYGRTTEAFVRDVIWPVLEGIAVRNDVKYTSSVLCVASEKDAFPSISESLFLTMGKSALQFDGELAYAVNCEKLSDLYVNEDFIKNFKRTFTEYEIPSMVMISGKPIAESKEKLGNKVSAVRGKMDSAQEERLFYSDSYVVFPELSRGIHLKDGAMLQIASGLSSHGAISHTINVNELINVDDMTPAWDHDKRELEELESRVLKKTDYLDKRTLSATKNIVKSYQNLEYSWKKEAEKIELCANHFVKGQTFFLRTNKKIKSIENADYEKVADNYYMIRLLEPKAVIAF